MPLYELLPETIERVPSTSFAVEGILERGDLQRLLRDQIDAVSPGLYVVAEEFGGWDESRRRIDLLAIDQDANLVVVELKRTDEGGHMELQALRYAAMVSSMTFEQVVEAHERYLTRRGLETDAQSALLEFLGWDEPSEEDFGQAVRIVLVAADFSKEVTTTVIWLNDCGLDVRCVRIRPYRHAGSILLDVQQIIPLPEAEEYQVQLREKARQERQARASGRSNQRYRVVLGNRVHEALPKRRAIFEVVRHLCSEGVHPDAISQLIPWKGTRLWRSVDGTVDESSFRALATTEAQNGGKAFHPKRWFCREGQLIVAGGRTYAFSNQWGHRTLEAIERLIETYPDVSMSCEAASD